MVLHAAPSLEALMLNPGNKFHALKGNRKGQFAISINKQWRVCFDQISFALATNLSNFSTSTTGDVVKDIPVNLFSATDVAKAFS